MRYLILFLLVVLAAAAAGAQTAPADAALIRSLEDSAARYAAGRTVVLVESGALTPDEGAAFAARLDRARAAIERVIGQGLDRVRYGTDTLYAVVSERVVISHVYGAYEHMDHPHPYLFLAPAKVRDGSAPYLHEATHLLAWRFGSLSLREGFASYVEARVSAELVLPSPGLFGVRDTAGADLRAAELLEAPAAAAVLPWIGRAGIPEPSITSSENRPSRAAFYVLSQSFTQHLVGALGMAAFLEVYAAEDPSAQLQRTTGRSLEDWKDEWLARVARRAEA